MNSKMPELINHLLRAKELLSLNDRQYEEGSEFIEKQAFRISQLNKSHHNLSPSSTLLKLF